MLSSNNSSCNDNPPIITTNFSEKDITSSCNSFFNFPNSPHNHLEYEDVYLQFLQLLSHDNDEQLTMTTTTTKDAIPVAHTTLIMAGDSGEPTRKRSSKKDRHSKINTARGPRDRRMRLSLDIARKFFGLQDLLGYDKASRTVDWLLRNSRDAIMEVARAQGVVANVNQTSNSVSSTCEDCTEVVSSSTTRVDEPPPPPPPPPPLPKFRNKQKVKRVARTSVARESRREARERARERTSQKRRLTSNGDTDQSLVSHSFNVPIYDMQATSSCSWNPSINYQDNAAFLSQDEQIPDFNFSENVAWDVYNRLNLFG